MEYYIAGNFQSDISRLHILMQVTLISLKKIIMECCHFHTIFRVIFKVIANGSKHVQVKFDRIFGIQDSTKIFSVNIYSSTS